MSHKGPIMGNLSVIIPTLNAAGGLRRSLPPLAEFESLDLLRELILADGGSNDETLAIGEAAGVTTVSVERGRGVQLAAGAEAASGEWLLFLHADTVLDAGWADCVYDFMVNDSNRRRAGYFRFTLDDDRFAARILERAVAFRCRWLGLPYGDQGLLISREFYKSLGGYPVLSLMEDVALIRRIGRRRLAPVAGRATTSAVRYQRDGYVLRPLRNLLCLSLYFLGAPQRLLRRLYA
jgi:rSAM/selenodomain-associated transferase 2